MPKVGLQVLSEEVRRDAVTSRFANGSESDSDFTVKGDGGDSAFFELSLGSTAVFKRGWSGFFEYTGSFAYDHFSASQLQLGVRYEFL